MTTPLAIFAVVVAALATQRLLELRHSRRNEARLREQGAIEHAPEQLVWMKLVHTGWFIAMLAEVVMLDRAFSWPVAAVAFAVLLAGQALRYAAMTGLGRRWSVRIYTLPGTPPVDTRAYRYVRHPNYLGVQLEMMAVPLLHGAWMTSIVFGTLNAVILTARIRAEEDALIRAGGYVESLGTRPRLFPRLFSTRRTP